MNDPSEVPTFGDLSPADKANLRSISSPEDLKEVKLLGSWRDDHELCVAARINGTEVSVWWIDWEWAAAFCFPDSLKAKTAIVEVLHETDNLTNEENET